jgi:Uma2 family endonuclease
MAISQQRVWTIEAFQEFVARPENSDRLFELINGELAEKMPGRTRNSELALIIATIVRPFCRAHNLPCHISGEAGAYLVDGNVVAPDFAYKRTPTSKEYPDPVAPEWVVEIISPTDKAPEIRAKRQIYLRAGILYWEMYPESLSIDVYASGQPIRTVEKDEAVAVGELIPGFTIPVNEIFAEG